ncbi:hypothetical protein 2200_scaffold2278_00037 [Bacteriophage sp.]|nr:hypothetical protein 2200_scaffold2278_00037 [Bacteriophage sp.]
MCVCLLWTKNKSTSYSLYSYLKSRSRKLIYEAVLRVAAHERGSSSSCPGSLR